MGVLADVYFKKETLETILKTLNSKNEKGISMTISISDETNQWGQNLSAYVSQSKEEREAKKNRFFTGNGKVFWTDGKVVAAEKKEQNNQPQVVDNLDVENDDLPF